MLYIMAQTSTEIIRCFTWRHGAAAGIALAKQQAAKFGIDVIAVWAE